MERQDKTVKDCLEQLFAALAMQFLFFFSFKLISLYLVLYKKQRGRSGVLRERRASLKCHPWAVVWPEIHQDTEGEVFSFILEI